MVAQKVKILGSMNALEGPKNVSEEYIARTEVVRGISEPDYIIRTIIQYIGRGW